MSFVSMESSSYRSDSIMPATRELNRKQDEDGHTFEEKYVSY